MKWVMSLPLSLQAASAGLDRRRHDLRVALVADPALFPAVVEVGLVAAEMVDEVHRHRMMADELGDHVLGAAQQRRGAVAVVHLAGRRDARHPLVGRGNERRPAAVLRGIESGDQRRGAGLQRAADVGRKKVLLDRQRRADDAGILAILEGMGGRGEVEAAHVLGLVAGEAIARGLDGHGDRILVPVGHRALALGEAAQAGGKPLVGVVDGLTVETQARHIGAIGDDSDHSDFLPTRMNGRLFPRFSAPRRDARDAFDHGCQEGGTTFRSAKISRSLWTRGASSRLKRTEPAGSRRSGRLYLPAVGGSSRNRLR